MGRAAGTHVFTRGSLAGLLACGLACAASAAATEKALQRVQMDDDFGWLPLYFVENCGQLDARVAYSLLGLDTAVYFTARGMTFTLSRPGARASVALDFVDAREGTSPAGRDRTQARVSYFKGPREQWTTGLGTYSSVVYQDVWPGIDVVALGSAGRLEYRFELKPGADPRRIRLRYRGASSVKIDADGGLEVTTAAGVLAEEPPVAFQESDGRREDVAAAYVLRRDGDDFVYSFELGPHDRSRPLVIDPVVLVYCGYIGGARDEAASAIAVDTAGNAYVTGSTHSTEVAFPVTVGPDLTYNGDAAIGGSDIFVAKVKADGSGLDYCGYIGGYLGDDSYGIAVDAAGNAYVGGATNSNEATFPVVVGPDLTYNGGSDAFVAKVRADGTSLDYAGYIGGNRVDAIYAIAVDTAGNACLTGKTESNETTFPVIVGPDLTFNMSPSGFDSDAFVARVKADGTGLDYAGYIGGNRKEEGTGIALDSVRNAYVLGITESSEATFPATIGPDLTYNGGTVHGDAFVAKVKADGTALDYAGYIGGVNDELTGGIAVDAAGSAYVCGSTPVGVGFPVTVGPDLTHNESEDVFVAKVKADGTGLDYCGFIGGSAIEYGKGIAVDAAGHAYVTGRTSSNEATFPVTVGPDLTYNSTSLGNSLTDAFVAKVKADGTGLDYCGYIGGARVDAGFGIALDTTGNVYVTGYTGSSEVDFPVSVGPGLLFNGAWDAFVAKVSTIPCAVMSLVPPPMLRGYKDGNGARFEWGSDPIATEYHLNTVTTTDALHETDPTSVHQAPRGQGETQCTTTGLTCTDVDAVIDPRPLLFYQVFAACGPTGADEGPMCPASDPCP